jgi:phage shock protein PspC (stress-responsive transcriptional regulator)
MEPSGMQPSNGAKRLYRKPEGRIVAGVCTGLADYLGIDVTIIRLVFVALTVFGGAGALLYLIAWAVVPEHGEKASIVENVVNKNRGA